MRRCAFVTLGCKANAYDTQVIREQLLGLGGYHEVAPGEPADLVIVNTCTVTVRAGKKSRQELHRVAREHPRALVVATGCYAESDRAALLADRSVGLVVGPAELHRIAELVAAEHRDREPLPVWGNRGGDWSVPGISRMDGQTRAYLKIQDGCDVFCSFCVIPYVRGPVRSRPIDDVVAEAERLVAHGHREIVLTGIHLGAYGQDLDIDHALVRLLDRLVTVRGLGRIRLSSIDGWEITPTLLDRVCADPRIAPHLHVPLQSGSDAVLGRMRRRGGRDAYLALVDAVRTRASELALSTDVIVGFPGETDRDFEDTLDVCRRAAFMRIHAFPYSDRPGTGAHHLEPKVSDAVKDARAARVAEVEHELAGAYRRRFLGRAVPVLVERVRDHATGLLTGYSDRYLKAVFAGPDALAGTIAIVRLTGEAGARVTGEVAA